jgi:23S rRNA pseudouridine1911/1915/1917 synthase
MAMILIGDLEANPDTASGETEAESAVDVRETRISAPLHGERLDKVLVTMAGEFSRSHLQSLILRGHVQVDGQAAASASRRLRIGQHLRLELVPTAQALAFRPEAIALTIVYEDDQILVIDKPAGLVVHPAAGNWSGTLLNGLLAHHPAAAGLPRAGIVHRLDKDTSGLMVVAKTLPAMTALVRDLSAREVRRVYLALAHGEVVARQQTIEAPIGRDPASRIRMAVVGSGKPARTEVECLAKVDGVSLLRCRLHTGRTHQIRVHMASRGHPLVGDAVYGGRPMLGMSRQALHAASLSFSHPSRPDDVLRFDRPPPPDLAAAISLLGQAAQMAAADPGLGATID